MAGEKIIIVDDDDRTCSIVHQYLEKEGFQVIRYENGQQAIARIGLDQPHLVLLDVVLPLLSGYEVCKQLRKMTNIPIMFLSNKSDDRDIVFGLGIGADDYMTKPFSPRQLVARVKAHLRRSLILDQCAEIRKSIAINGLHIDLISHQVTLDDQPVTLSSKEFELLVVLAKHPNRVFKIDDLFQLIWGSESLGDTRTLMVHISNLRKKVESDPSQPKYILTVRGVGYKFHSPLEEQQLS